MSDSTAFPVRSPPVGVLGSGTSSRTSVRDNKRFQGTQATGTAVWSWVLVVLGLLMALKIVLVLGQSHGLYETHWRVGGIRVTWLNHLAFFSFVTLGGLGLVRLSAECQANSVKTVRLVNAVVLVLGLTYIFLTFHNGNRNFFYPVLSGVLSCASLGPYVANALFFNPPFLGAWIFVYTASYYVLVRSGRERLALSLTTGFAIAYAVIYLRDQVGFRNELLIADCVGVVSVVAAWRRDRAMGTPSARFGVWWLLLPLGWTLFFGWALLRFDGDWQSNAAKYLLGLIGLTALLFGGSSWLVRKAGNPAAWSWLVAFYAVSFFLLTDTNYPSSGNYSHLICLALTFPRYISADIGLVGLLGLVAVLYRRFRPGGSLWWLNLAGLALIIIAGIDLRLSQIMGVRLGWDVLAFGDSPKMMLRMAEPYLPGVLVGLAAIVLVYSLALRASRTWLSNRRCGRFFGGTEKVDSARRDSSSARFPSAPGTIGLSTAYTIALATCLGALGLCIAESDKAEDQAVVRLVRTSPLWKRVASRPMSREKFLSSAAALGLGHFPPEGTLASGKARRDLNVLVVFMESSYNKHLSLFGSSEETQPLLTKYKDRMELFPNFFSAFTGSIHARFATFTSLYPVRDFDSFTQERVPVKSLFEIFHEQGYSCSMFYSSYFDYTGFRDFLKNRGLDEMYDADTMPGQRGTERVAWGLLEEETLGAIRNQLKKYAQAHQHFCLTYVPAAPHYPYDRIPKPFQKHKMEEVGDFTPLYLNELLYMDWVIASIIDELKESGLLDNTLVVITNDHGEMLGGKDGHLGHGWAVTPQLANTPLILMDPERPGFQINKTVGTQVDVLPTVLDRLHIPIPADQLYEGISLDAASAREGRVGYLNSFKEFGIISGNQVLLGDRESSEPSGVASQGAVFTISNEDTKTAFTEAEQTGTIQDRQATMAHFDAFQESLLRNYSAYCASVLGAPQTLAKRAEH